jgi:mono/diheme cytochrome c family protein
MKLLTRIGIGLGMLGFVVSAVLGWVWWRSEVHLRSFHPAGRFAVAIPGDRASLAWGAHIARTRGCYGCHGDALQGEVFDDGPWYGGGRVVAANLASLAKSEDAAALEAAIRQGIGHDGRALYNMPSYNFANLSDGDIAALIGFLKAVPARATRLPRGYLGWQPRWAMATGSDFAIPYYITRMPLLTHKTDPRPEIRLGEYLAMTSCNECHGFGLRGDEPWAEPGRRSPPDLAGLLGYTRGEFETLMLTGKAKGNRELRLMSEVARGRFAHWTGAERDALYAFLSTMPQ